MNQLEPEYSSRILAIQNRSKSILQTLRSNDAVEIEHLVQEERQSYQSLMLRLSDEMENGKSPALRSIASNLYHYFQSMQQLAQQELVSEMQSDSTNTSETEEEAAGLMEEYTLDSIEQSLRAILLMSYHTEPYATEKS